MKFVVVSNKTIERAIIESSILGDMKSDKEIELEKKKKEEEIKKKEEEKNKNNNDKVIINKDDKKGDSTENKTTTPPPENKTTTPPPENKTTTPPPENKTTTPPPEPPKPTNPSGKLIPKPKKPLNPNSPAAKAGIPIEQRQKMSNMNAAFQATKNKNSGYTKMDFIKDFPNSQTAKKYRKGEMIPGFKYPKKTKVKPDPGPDLKAMSQYSKPSTEVTIDDFKSTSTPDVKTMSKYSKPKENIKSSYEPYHVVLGYLLHEGHADTINEAHYVMTQMDEKTIQEIVALDEGMVASTAKLAGALTLGGMGLNAIRKMMKNKKTMDQGGKFRQGSTLDNIQKRNQMLKDAGM